MESSAGEEMVIMPLGGGQEVGRSCILLQYQSRNILLDCGCHPGREGDDSLPFFDALSNPEDIDLILITHFHIDHCAALPYFTERTDFKGKIYMTHPTKAVMKLLLSDNIRLQSKGQGLYNEQDLQNCIDKIDVINYHQTVEYKGIKFTATHAGHVLGAAMFSIEIDGIKVLYTGDYSMEEDRHLSCAEIPPGGPPDVLIVESTFGTMNMDGREKREEKFTHAVESIVSRGGSCLIPVFALGRAQELLLILENYWRSHLDLQHIPIFYASKLATRSLRVYQTFVNMMNQQVQTLSDQFRNPFHLQHVRSIQHADLDVFGACVVMASPGFLQSGVSRQLFEAWCDDERHGVIIAGYTIEGTLAHELLSDPKEIRCLDNRIKPRRCRIESISFSAHVDFTHNKGFIKTVQPDGIVLVHGEKKQMRSLKDALEHEIRSNNWPTRHKPTIATPENCTQVRFRFKKNIQAAVEGAVGTELLKAIELQQQQQQQNLVNNSSKHPNTVSLPPHTLLVTENFASKLVSAGELAQQTQCRLGSISEKLHIPLPQEAAVLLAQLELSRASLFVAEALEDIYEEVETVSVDELEVQQVVLVRLVTAPLPSSSAVSGERVVALEVVWKASALADFIADSVASLLMQLFSATNMLKLSLQQQQQQQASISGQRRSIGRVLRGHPPPSSSVATTSVEATSDATSTKKPREDSDSNKVEQTQQMIAAGQIDPFLALPAQCALPPFRSLQQLAEQLLQAQQRQQPAAFESIDVTQDGSKLRFRSLPSPLCPEPHEAYVYVLFDEHAQSKHQAVVSAEDEDFRSVVCAALQALV